MSTKIEKIGIAHSESNNNGHNIHSQKPGLPRQNKLHNCRDIRDEKVIVRSRNGVRYILIENIFSLLYLLLVCLKNFL